MIGFYIILSAIGILVCLFLLAVYFYPTIGAMRSFGYRQACGVESFVGGIGEATTALNLTGTVRFRGAYWNAESSEQIVKGQEVRVVRVEGLRLIVESR